MMLSRVADSLYWMSRYLERAEHTARILEVHLNLMLDRGSVTIEGRWDRVLKCLGNPIAGQGFLDPYQLAHTLAFDGDNRSSIVSSIMAARENARQVREQISSEMWEQLNRLSHRVRSASEAGIPADHPFDFLRVIREGSHLFQGITDSTMSHEQGWQFIQIGRALERAISVTALVDTYYADPEWYRRNVVLDPLEWIGMLKAVTAFEAYCKKHGAEPNQDWIAEFLVLDGEFPHSVRFCADQIAHAVECIGDHSRPAGHLLRLTGKMRAQLGYAQVEEIMNSGINEFLRNIERQCLEVDLTLRDAYIGYSIEEALGA
ncbi:MAG: alpha-E domain-containing protein [Bryobacteraceae bacterium]